MAAGKAKMVMPGYREDVLVVLDELLDGRPDVRRGSMMGLPGYFTGKKMFACCFDEGIGVKLPVARVAALQAADDEIHPHMPGGRVMKEWVYIARDDVNAYRGDIDLLNEAIAFVANAA
ncbi:MAG: hypothetical protein ACRD1H_20010 [Vicinamibacterales bacterium]